MTPAGNWEGRTILRRVTPPGDAATKRAARARRAPSCSPPARSGVRPGRDDKVLADWNGLAIAALCRAAAVFGQPAWLARARRALRLRPGRHDGAGRPRAARLAARAGSPPPGLLDDQAAMARAALALFEATGEPALSRPTRSRWRRRPSTLFGDRDGGFFTTASDATDVPLGAAARPRTAADNATPSGNGMMAEVLARLFHLTGDAALARRGPRPCCARSAASATGLRACPTLLAAADLLEEGAVVVVAGPIRTTLPPGAAAPPRSPRPTRRSACCAPAPPPTCRPCIPAHGKAAPPAAAARPISAAPASAGCR